MERVGNLVGGISVASKGHRHRQDEQEHPSGGQVSGGAAVGAVSDVHRGRRGGGRGGGSSIGLAWRMPAIEVKYNSNKGAQERQNKRCVETKKGFSGSTNVRKRGAVEHQFVAPPTIHNGTYKYTYTKYTRGHHGTFWYTQWGAQFEEPLGKAYDSVAAPKILCRSCLR